MKLIRCLAAVLVVLCAGASARATGRPLVIVNEPAFIVPAFSAADLFLADAVARDLAIARLQRDLVVANSFSAFGVSGFSGRAVRFRTADVRLGARVEAPAVAPRFFQQTTVQRGGRFFQQTTLRR